MAVRYLLFLAFFVVLGCATVRPQDAYLERLPKTAVVRNITSFGESIACMDQLFLSQGTRDIPITSVGIPDATGQISAGTREMMISAISRMSARSGAFVYVDWDFSNKELQLLYNVTRDGNRELHDRVYTAPRYYVRGAITQLDRNVLDGRKGGGLSASSGVFQIDASGDVNRTVSVVTLDMNVGEVLSRRILPGLTASNSLAVGRTGKGLSSGARIEKNGVFFSMDLDKSEGMHQAVRTLVELGAIEILGKIAQVPYWKCLQIDETNPEILLQVRDWYDGMSEAERVSQATDALDRLGYAGSVDLRSALSRFQADRGLVPSGRINFESYRKLVGAGRATPDVSAAPEPVRIPPPLSLVLESDRGAAPTYKPSEEIRVTASPSRGAYLYCFYQDAAGSVARIFPNRYQPDPYVAAGEEVEIPGPDAGFRIRFDTAHVYERIGCLASVSEIGLELPVSMKTADLDPLPVSDLDELFDAFEAIDPTGPVVERLDIRVTN